MQRAPRRSSRGINYQYKPRLRGRGVINGYGGQSKIQPQGYNGYAYNQSSARVLGVTSVERRSSNGLRVRGVATARAHQAGYGGYAGQGGYSPYGGYGGYAPQQTGELTFKCNIDYRGYVTDVDLDRNRYAYRNYRNY